MAGRSAALAFTVLLLLAAPAGATKITYVCGNDLCRIDLPRLDKVQRLTRDGADQPYGAPSLSWDGRQMAFFRGFKLYRSSAAGTRRRPLDSADAPPDPGRALMSPTGNAVASTETRWVSFGHDGTLVTYQEQAVYVYPEPDEVGRHVAVSATATWLGGSLAVGLRRDQNANQVITLLADGPVRERVVAGDPGFDIWWPSASRDARFVVATKVIPADARRGALQGRISLFNAKTGRLIRDLTHGAYDANPVFSPDGAKVAFNRGRDLYVIRTDGADVGHPRFLHRDALSPAWSR